MIFQPPPTILIFSYFPLFGSASGLSTNKPQINTRHPRHAANSTPSRSHLPIRHSVLVQCWCWTVTIIIIVLFREQGTSSNAVGSTQWMPTALLHKEQIIIFLILLNLFTQSLLSTFAYYCILITNTELDFIPYNGKMVYRQQKTSGKPKTNGTV